MSAAPVDPDCGVEVDRCIEGQQLEAKQRAAPIDLTFVRAGAHRDLHDHGF